MAADPVLLLSAARRILDSAAGDLERGHWLSACVSAQRAALMATEAWLRAEGQPVVSAAEGDDPRLEAPGAVAAGRIVLAFVIERLAAAGRRP